MRIKYLKSLNEMPEFSTREEEAEFWDTHSVAEIWDQLEPVELEVSGPLKARVEERLRRHEACTFELDPEQLEAARKIAERKKTSYWTLIKQWIDEGIQRESA